MLSIIFPILANFPIFYSSIKIVGNIFENLFRVIYIILISVCFIRMYNFLDLKIEGNLYHDQVSSFIDDYMIKAIIVFIS